jgi:hypothetical protein
MHEAERFEQEGTERTEQGANLLSVLSVGSCSIPALCLPSFLRDLWLCGLQLVSTLRGLQRISEVMSQHFCAEGVPGIVPAAFDRIFCGA